jgi:hypothetical protein
MDKAVRLTHAPAAFPQIIRILEGTIPGLSRGAGNFVRVHQTPRGTPAMEAGITDHVRTIDEMPGRCENMLAVIQMNGYNYTIDIKSE